MTIQEIDAADAGSQADDTLTSGRNTAALYQSIRPWRAMWHARSMSDLAEVTTAIQGNYAMSKHTVAEHHTKAAKHHEHASKHHHEAAKHHAEGDAAKAAQHAHLAHGHVLHATHHLHEATKQLGAEHADQ